MRGQNRMKKYLSNLKRAGLLALVTAGSLLTTSTPSKAEVNTYEELKVEQNRQEQANVQENIARYNNAKKNIATQIGELDKQSKRLKCLIVGGIRDRELSRKETNEILREYCDIQEKRRKIAGYAETNKVNLGIEERGVLNLSQDQELYSGLVSAQSFSGRKLEKYFSKKGLIVDVKGQYGFPIALGIIFGLGLPLGIIGTAICFGQIPGINKEY